MKENDSDIYPQIRHLFDRARLEPQHVGIWLTAKFWVSKINFMAGKKVCDTGTFNRLMTNKNHGFPACEFESANPHGVFRYKQGGKYYYYLTQAEETFEMPKNKDGKWAEAIERHSDGILYPAPMLNSPESKPPPSTTNTSGKRVSSHKRGQPLELSPPSSSQRRRITCPNVDLFMMPFIEFCMVLMHGNIMEDIELGPSVTKETSIDLYSA